MKLGMTVPEPEPREKAAEDFAKKQQCAREYGGCEKWYPLTEEFWHRDGENFRRVCKLCRNKIEQERELQRKSEIIDNLDDKLRTLLVRSAESGGSDVPHTREMVEILLRGFGGPVGFGRHVIGEFLAAPRGGAIRQKTVSDVLRMIVKVSESGDANKRAKQMSTEELETAAAKILQAMYVQRRLEQESIMPESIRQRQEIRLNGPEAS